MNIEEQLQVKGIEDSKEFADAKSEVDARRQYEASLEGCAEKMRMEFGDSLVKQYDGDMPGYRAAVNALVAANGYEPKDMTECEALNSSMTRFVTNGNTTDWKRVTAAFKRTYDDPNAEKGTINDVYSPEEAYKFLQNTILSMVDSRHSYESVMNRNMLAAKIGLKPGEDFMTATPERQEEIADNAMSAFSSETWAIGIQNNINKTIGQFVDVKSNPAYLKLAKDAGYVDEHGQLRYDLIMQMNEGDAILGKKVGQGLGPVAKPGYQGDDVIVVGKDEEGKPTLKYRMGGKESVRQAKIGSVMNRFGDMDRRFSFIRAANLCNKNPKAWEFLPLILKNEREGEIAFASPTYIYMRNIPLKDIWSRLHDIANDETMTDEEKKGTVNAVIGLVQAVDKGHGFVWEDLKDAPVRNAIGRFAAGALRAAEAAPNTLVGKPDKFIEEKLAQSYANDVLTKHEGAMDSDMRTFMKDAMTRLYEAGDWTQIYSSGSVVEDTAAFISDLYGMGPFLKVGGKVIGGGMKLAAKTGFHVSKEAGVKAPKFFSWMAKQGHHFADGRLSPQQIALKKRITAWRNAGEAAADIEKMEDGAKLIMLGDKIADFMTKVPGGLALAWMDKDKDFAQMYEESTSGALTEEQSATLESYATGKSIFKGLMMAGLYHAAGGDLVKISKGLNVIGREMDAIEAVAQAYDELTLKGILKYSSLRMAKNAADTAGFVVTMEGGANAIDNARKVWAKKLEDPDYVPTAEDWAAGYGVVGANAIKTGLQVGASQFLPEVGIKSARRFTKTGREVAEKIAEDQAKVANYLTLKDGIKSEGKTVFDTVEILEALRLARRGEKGNPTYAEVRDQLRKRYGEAGARIFENLNHAVENRRTESLAKIDDILNRYGEQEFSASAIQDTIGLVNRGATAVDMEPDAEGRKRVKLTTVDEKGGKHDYIVTQGRVRVSDEGGYFINFAKETFTKLAENINQFAPQVKAIWDALPEEVKKSVATEVERQVAAGAKRITDVGGLLAAVSEHNVNGVFLTQEDAKALGYEGLGDANLVNGLIVLANAESLKGRFKDGMGAIEKILGNKGATVEALLHEYFHAIQQTIIEPQLGEERLNKLKAGYGDSGEGWREVWVNDMLDYFIGANEAADAEFRASRGMRGKMRIVADAAKDFLFGIGALRDANRLREGKYVADMNEYVADILKSKTEAEKAKDESDRINAEVENITGKASEPAKDTENGEEIKVNAKESAETLKKAVEDIQSGNGEVTPEMKAHFALVVDQLGNTKAIIRDRSGRIEEGKDVSLPFELSAGDRVTVLPDALDGEVREELKDGAGIKLDATGGDYFVGGESGLWGLEKAGILAKGERQKIMADAAKAFDRARKAIWMNRIDANGAKQKFISNADLEEFVNGGKKKLSFKTKNGLEIVAHMTGVGGVNMETGKNTSWGEGGKRADNRIRYEIKGVAPKFGVKQMAALSEGGEVKVSDVVKDNNFLAAYPDIANANIYLQGNVPKERKDHVAVVDVYGTDTQTGVSHGVRVDKLPISTKVVYDPGRGSETTAAAMRSGDVIVFSPKGDADFKRVNEDISHALFNLVAAREGFGGRSIKRNSDTGRIEYVGSFTLDEYSQKAGRSSRNNEGHVADSVYALFGDQKLNLADRNSVIMLAAEKFVREHLKKNGIRATKKQVEENLDVARSIFEKALQDAGAYFARELEAEAYAKRDGKSPVTAKGEENLIDASRRGLIETGGQRAGAEATKRNLDFYKNVVAKGLSEMFGGEAAQEAFGRIFDEQVEIRRVRTLIRRIKEGSVKGFRSVAELNAAIDILKRSSDERDNLLAEQIDGSWLNWNKGGPSDKEGWQSVRDNHEADPSRYAVKPKKGKNSKKDGVTVGEVLDTVPEGKPRKEVKAAKSYAGKSKGQGADVIAAVEGNQAESDRYLDALEAMKRPMGIKLLNEAAKDLVKIAYERDGKAAFAPDGEVFKAILDAAERANLRTAKEKELRNDHATKMKILDDAKKAFAGAVLSLQRSGDIGSFSVGGSYNGNFAKSAELMKRLEDEVKAKGGVVGPENAETGKPALVYGFHGTTRGGFTKFDPGKSDDKMSIFASASKDVSRSYVGRLDITTRKGVKKILERLLDKNSKPSWIRDDYPEHLASLEARENYLANNAKVYVTEDPVFVDKGFLELLDRGLITDSEIASIGRYDIDRSVYDEGSPVPRPDNNIADILYEYKGITSYSPRIKGIYNLAIRMDNPFVVDANGRNWNNIEIDGEKGLSTRDIAGHAKHFGHDGVIIRNVIDDGGKGNIEIKPDDIFISFDGKKIKMIDEFTYDDKGNQIPVSARGDWDNPDARYSVGDDRQYVKVEVPTFAENVNGNRFIDELKGVTLQMPAYGRKGAVGVRVQRDSLGEYVLNYIDDRKKAELAGVVLQRMIPGTTAKPTVYETKHGKKIKISVGNYSYGTKENGYTEERGKYGIAKVFGKHGAGYAREDGHPVSGVFTFEEFFDNFDDVFQDKHIRKEDYGNGNVAYEMPHPTNSGLKFCGVLSKDGELVSFYCTRSEKQSDALIRRITKNEEASKKVSPPLYYLSESHEAKPDGGGDEGIIAKDIGGFKGVVRLGEMRNVGWKDNQHILKSIESATGGYRGEGLYSVGSSRTPTQAELYRDRFRLTPGEYDIMTREGLVKDDRSLRRAIAGREATKIRAARMRNSEEITLQEINTATGLDTVKEMLFVGSDLKGTLTSGVELAEKVYEGFMVNYRRQDERAGKMTISEMVKDPVIAADFNATVAGFVEKAAKEMSFGKVRQDALDFANELRHRVRPNFNNTLKQMSTQIDAMARQMKETHVSKIVKELEKKIDKDAMGKKPVVVEKAVYDRDVAPLVQGYWRFVKKSMRMTQKQVDARIQELKKRFRFGEEDISEIAGKTGDEGTQSIEESNSLKKMLAWQEMCALTRYGALAEKPLGRVYDQLRAAVRDIDIRSAETERIVAEHNARSESDRSVLIGGIRNVLQRRGGKALGGIAERRKGMIASNVLPDLFSKLAFDFKQGTPEYNLIQEFRRDMSLSHIKMAQVGFQLESRFKDAVERIYGMSFDKAMKALLTPNKDYARFYRGDWMIPEKDARKSEETGVRLAEGPDSPLNNGTLVRRDLSMGNLLYIYTAVCQEDMAKNNETYGRTARYIEDLRATIGPEGVAMVEWMRNELNEMRGKLTPVSERITGMPVLSPGDNYFMLEFEHPAGNPRPERYSLNMFPGFLMRRVNHDELRLNEGQDVFHLFHKRIMDSAHYIAFADVIDRAKSAFGNKDVRSAWRNMVGESAYWDIYEQLYQSFVGGYKGSGINWLTHFSAATTMFYNLTSAIKQFEGIAGYAAATSVLDAAVDIIRPWKWGMKEAAEVLATRKFEGFSPAASFLKEAVDNIEHRGWWRNRWRDYSRYGLSITTAIDSLATASLGGAFYTRRYNEMLRAGKTHEEARRIALADTDYAVQLGQQSSRPEFQIAAQRGTSWAGSLGRSLTQFAGPSFVRAGMEIEALHRVWIDTRNPEAWRSLCNKVLALHVICPTVLAMLNAVGISLTHKEDDKEWGKRIYRDWLISCLTGPFSGLFLTGSLIQYAADNTVRKSLNDALRIRHDHKPWFDSASIPAVDKLGRIIADGSVVAMDALKLFDGKLRRKDEKEIIEYLIRLADDLFPAERQVRRGYINVNKFKRNVVKPLKKGTKSFEKAVKKAMK